jgi:hypothetical protein
MGTIRGHSRSFPDERQQMVVSARQNRERVAAAMREE